MGKCLASVIPEVCTNVIPASPATSTKRNGLRRYDDRGIGADAAQVARRVDQTPPASRCPRPPTARDRAVGSTRPRSGRRSAPGPAAASPTGGSGDEPVWPRRSRRPSHSSGRPDRPDFGAASCRCLRPPDFAARVSHRILRSYHRRDRRGDGRLPGGRGHAGRSLRIGSRRFGSRGRHGLEGALAADRSGRWP